MDPSPLTNICLGCCSALVWGSSAKHKPQRVGKVNSSELLGLYILSSGFFVPLFSAIRMPVFTSALYQEHELEDEDVVQIIKKV